MAYRVGWSQTALEDVDAIASYISRDSISYAAAVVKKVLTQRGIFEIILTPVEWCPSLATTIYGKSLSTISGLSITSSTKQCLSQP